MARRANRMPPREYHPEPACCSGSRRTEFDSPTSGYVDNGSPVRTESHLKHDPLT